MAIVQPARAVCLTGETLLEEAVLMSARVGLVKACDHIVCVQQIKDSFVVKIVSVNEQGTGVQVIMPKSLENLVKVRVLCLGLHVQACWSLHHASGSPGLASELHERCMCKFLQGLRCESRSLSPSYGTALPALSSVSPRP